MENTESSVLCRVAINHLYLGQFEAFRAAIRSLRARDPDIARSILQTIITKGGRLEHNSSSSSDSLLTFLCTLELLQFNHPTSQIWSFHESHLKFRAEFLLYLQMVRSRVDVEDHHCVRVLDRLSDLGLARLNPDFSVKDDHSVREIVVLGEEEVMCLRRIILDNAELFDVLCGNVKEQLGWMEENDEVEEEEKESMAITLSSKGGGGEEEIQVLKIVVKCVQLVHLDAIRECLENKDDVDRAALHLRFLHLSYGVHEHEYRKVLRGLVKEILSVNDDDCGDAWFASRNKLLSMYIEALSSRSTRLVRLVQVTQDEILSEKVEVFQALDSDKIHYPLWRLENYRMKLKHDAELNEEAVTLKVGTTSWMREMYNYARVRGVHVLESVMDTALSAVRKEHLQEASNVLMLFPRLQPLVAVIGWDLLSGKTILRKKMMQLLWTSKSQTFRLEESQFYSSESDEVSCVEHLCDLLCYQLDLASFVACVNSGQSWSVKSSLLLSGKDFLESTSKDVQWDPFVENFVLERLSVQSPIRLLLAC